MKTGLKGRWQALQAQRIDVGQRFAALVGQREAAFWTRGDVRLLAEEQLDIGVDRRRRIGAPRR